MPELRFQTDQGALDIVITKLVVAGWTGRDALAVQHHIDELAALGVPAPSAVPLYYQVGPELLTQAATITALGPDTSGEVEPFVVADADGTLWLGLASDHTDRALEALSVAKSKQMCMKPVAPQLWRLDSVTPYLDDLVLHSDIRETGASDWVSYQRGPLAAIRPLPALIAALPDGRLAPGAALLCGTLPALGGIRPAAGFRMSLHDPVTGRRIVHRYGVTELPVVA
ncbi:DUF2848 domain-containing protein [Roseinatronobacter sp.]|uniref:DUF2848 domain-containing protein n=1 Tax=Roseinatronobacter sp. TaxID=1945755 RepID=UPI003F6E7888